MLHVTNGDSAAALLRGTGVTGKVLAWNDVLHEGPVPAGLALEAMSDLRARYHAALTGRPLPKLLREFGARDAALRSARRVVLWFEHDLHDQLQLVQILAVLAIQRETRAEIICISSFPGIEPFYGLGQLTPAQLASLWPSRRKLTATQLALGRSAWKAFTSPDPLAVRQFLATPDLASLPFLRAALERFLEEYPSPPDGLSRTDRQILRAVAAGRETDPAIFQANQAAEPAPFLADTAIAQRVHALVTARTPLLTREPIGLTAAGRRILAGETDARQLNGIDRWLGGVHLKA